MPSSLGQRLRRAQMQRLLRAQPLEQGLIRPRHAHGRLVEVHQPLQVDLAHADVVGDAHEVAELGDGLPQARQPQRHAWGAQPLARLHLGEGLHVAHDAIEVVLAAHEAEGRCVRRIERYAQLVEAGVGQLAALLGGQHGAVGVEQHVGAARLEVADHARQLFHEHRLAHPVQHHAGDVGHLVDDAREQLPAHVRLRLEVGIGARAGGAEQVAAVGRLQVEADRIVHRHGRARVGDAVVVAARIDGRAGGGVRLDSHGVSPTGTAMARRRPLQKSWASAASVARVKAAMRAS